MPNTSDGVASLAVRAAAASETPHPCEFDRWMTDPADVDYVEPDARWCRVCLRSPDHSIHSAARIAAEPRCYCPDDCMCRRGRGNYCGCKAH